MTAVSHIYPPEGDVQEKPCGDREREANDRGTRLHLDCTSIHVLDIAYRYIRVSHTYR